VKNAFFPVLIRVDLIPRSYFQPQRVARVTLKEDLAQELLGFPEVVKGMEDLAVGMEVRLSSSIGSNQMGRANFNLGGLYGEAGSRGESIGLL
jgi:hypothetical protein